VNRKIPARKPAFFMTEDIQTPPMGEAARREAGFLVGRLQEGVSLGMPQARPMPCIGSRCLELRVRDENVTWRVMCRVDPDAVLVIHSFAKKTEATPQDVIRLCRRRLAAYDATA
jgi:phage-related protein